MPSCPTVAARIFEALLITILPLPLMSGVSEMFTGKEGGLPLGVIE